MVNNITHRMKTVRGIGIGSVSAMGKLRFFGRFDNEKRDLSVGTPEQEKRLFSEAAELAKKQLDGLYTKAKESIGEKEAEIFAIHKMLLEDEEYLETVESFIFSGQSAAASVLSCAEVFENMFSELDDDYLSARAADIKDVSGRLYRIIVGKGAQEETVSGDPFILVADDLSPSETLQLDRAKLLGFVTFSGSPNSHTAILARAMGIPAVIGTGEISRELEGKNAIIDSHRGELIIDPDLAALDRYTDEVRRRAQEEQRLRALIGRESRTKKGKRIKLYANIGSAEEAELAYKNDAEGIGLLRSEFLYIGASEPPDEETQLSFYRAAVERMHSRPVIIRTLDIGADKNAEYFNIPTEENPALGFRAIRFCLENEDIFKTQLRAICRASAKGKVALMLPMVISCSEVRRSRELLIEVKNELRYECVDFDENIPMGIMIETPAAAMMSEELARYCDFFSVGTNDLIQYTLAADRQNPRLSKLCEENLEPVFRLIEKAVKNAHKAGIWIGVCGELASRPEYIEKLLKMGIDELSVSPQAVLSVREKIIEYEGDHNE